MAGNNLAGLSASRSSAVSLASRTGKHELYIVPYDTAGNASPAAANNYTELVFSPFEVAGTNAGSDLTRIDRVVVPQRGAVSYDDQELFLPVVSGDPLLKALIDREVASETSSRAGEKMAFWRFFNDRSFYDGELQVQRVRQVGDPDADDGYFVTIRILRARRHEANENPATPTVTSNVSPTTGAAGTDLTVLGTDLNYVSAVEFVTSAGAITATVSTFITKVFDRLVFDSPSGLTAGTVYNVRLAHPAGAAVAAGTFTG